MRALLAFAFLFSSALCYNIKREILDKEHIEPYIFEDIINSTIEGIRPSIPEPIEIADLPITLPDEEGALIKGNASISNFRLSGLHDFQLTALQFDLAGLQLNFTLNLPVIDLYTDYTLNLLVADTLALYGDGSLAVQMENLQIQALGNADLTGGIQITNLAVNLQIGTAHFEIHGLLNDEDLSQLISNILNDLAVKLVDENQELITQIISPIIEAIINAILTAILSK